MKFISRRHATIATAVLTAVSVIGVSPVRAAVRSFGKNYQVTATVKGAQNMTVLLMSAKGQTLASASVTKSSQKITLKTAPTTSTKGATLQLVSGSGKAGKGAYYGPVVIGWKGTKASTASKVTSKLKASTSTKISLGTVQVKAATGSTKQGYAVALAASKLADTSTASLAKASKGKPSGVGNYGKNQSVSSGDFTVSFAAVGDPCSPPGTQTCGPDGKEIGAPTGGVNQPVGNQPANNAAPAAAPADDLNGGDKDDDGIPNAFDVNDDGDAVVDSADSSTPAPQVGVENASCGQVSFKIFTNYKATQAGFAGTINAYGTGAFKAGLDNIASTITKTMSMVFQPITSVCGSNVTASYLKGNGAPYAPTDFVKLGGTCITGDFQWQIGAGKMCGDPATSYSFGPGYTFTGSDLPSGQDTFTMKVETADGNSYEFTSSPGFVFVTHPMFTAFSTDGVNYTSIDYSKTMSSPDGVRLAADPIINVTQTQTLWLKVYRPQRLAIDGETGTFYDLGGFKWTPDIPNGNPSPGTCDALRSVDTTMTNDTAINEASPPQLILQWSIGSKCYGVAPRNAAWQPGGGDFDIKVEPTGPGGNAAQKVRITLA
ncbi:MAG: hypothetical protein RLZZ526_83 [Actinomycetota bacterium]